MLTLLHIRNYALIQELSIEFNRSLTVITGETGVGKSILLDALSICLGGRIDSKQLRQSQNSCEISAIFNIQRLEPAKQWLQAQELLESGLEECIIRRVIHPDGRSRAYINGRLFPLQQIAELASFLIEIHGQHQQQQLLRRDTQRELLDAYANNAAELQAIKMAYYDYQRIQQQLQALYDLGHDAHTEELLRYQLHELTALQLQAGEFEQLEHRFKLLTQSEKLLQTCQQILEVADQADINLNSLLQQNINALSVFSQHDPAIARAVDLFTQAQICVNEASDEINHFIDHAQLDPASLQEVSDRLDTIHQLGRKHRIAPSLLHEKAIQLEEQLSQFTNRDAEITQLKKQLDTLLQTYNDAAEKLTQKRQKTAKKLTQAVNQKLPLLGMQHAKFEIVLTAYDEKIPRINGNDQIEFLICTNPGQPFLPINKIASGGELSRISLAIEVATAQYNAIPTIIFDEVDVGIGGSTAAVVGKLLRELGQHIQVMCVTHQPQVASYAHQHLCVQKRVNDEKTHVSIEVLNQEGKINEIARMLGGVKITQQTLAHAKEMLAEAE